MVIAYLELTTQTMFRIVFGVRSRFLNIHFNAVLYLFKTNFKLDEKLNAKGIQNNGIWNYTAKGC